MKVDNPYPPAAGLLPSSQCVLHSIKSIPLEERKSSIMCLQYMNNHIYL